MIILDQLSTLIITPGKCGSSTLHNTLCKGPHNFIYCIGPQGPWREFGLTYADCIGKHTTYIPWSYRNYKKYMVVRNKFERFISLWQQYCRMNSQVTLEDYIDLVPCFSNDLWFYKQRMEDYIKETEGVELIDLSILELELCNIIGHYIELPRLNKRSGPYWETFYTSELYDRVEALA